MRSRSSSPPLEAQRYDLSKRVESKQRKSPPPVMPPASEVVVSSKVALFDEDDRIFLDSSFHLSGDDSSNDHITAVVDIDISKTPRAKNSPYQSDDPPTSTSSISTINFAENDEDVPATHEPGYLYTTKKNSTVLIIRRRTSFFRLGGVLPKSPTSSAPPIDWKSGLNSTLCAYSCGPCAGGSSAFEDEVKIMQKQYEKEIKGEMNPIRIRLDETRNVSVEERWRKPMHDIVYPRIDADEMHVVSRVEVL